MNFAFFFSRNGNGVHRWRCFVNYAVWRDFYFPKCTQIFLFLFQFTSWLKTWKAQKFRFEEFFREITTITKLPCFDEFFVYSFQSTKNSNWTFFFRQITESQHNFSSFDEFFCLLCTFQSFITLLSISTLYRLYTSF